MSNYVHVVKDTDLVAERIRKLLFPYIDNYLYSLFNAFSESHTFGYNNIDKISHKIKTCYDILDSVDKKLLIDSGGYSIIKGQVNSRECIKFIQCYDYFLKKHSDLCHYIFSLDVPIFVKEPAMNTAQNIYKFNKASYGLSKKTLDQQPDLYDKFIFVWQFKLQKQFRVWRQIFDETFSDEKRLHHFAIGGMVRLRQITKIKFSPFIGMAYKILKLIYDRDLPKTSIMHMLGVFQGDNRFIIYFLDRLFNQVYLKDKQCKIKSTYDTMNFIYNGLHEAREMIFLEAFPNGILDLPKYVKDESIRQSIEIDIENVKSGQTINDLRLFGSMYMLYVHIVNEQMQKVIDDYGLVDIFINAANFYQFKNNLIPILDAAAQQYPLAFTGLASKVFESFRWIHAFHSVWENNKSMTAIDKGIEKMISVINFPYDLE